MNDRPGSNGARAVAGAAARTFRKEVSTAYLEALTEPDRNAHPLGAYTLGPAFIDTVAKLSSDARERLPRVCAMVIAGRADKVTSVPLQTPTGPGVHDSAIVTRARDGAVAWRVRLQDAGNGVPCLHYWMPPDGIPELACVVQHHDDCWIPE